jgi:alpha-tubulin suppressor-like RCC1 family protein
MGRRSTKGQWVALALVAFGVLGGGCAAFNDAKMTSLEEGEGEREDESGRDRRTGAPVEGESSTPVHLAMGESFSCAWREGGEARCWGANGYGQLGRGVVSADVASTPGPVLLGSGKALTGVRQMALGRHHACALLDDGTVLCWGGNPLGELGNGVLGGEPVARPGPVLDGEGAPLANVLAIASGDDHACAQLDDATLRCWGRTSFEEAGRVGVAEAPQGAPFARPVFVEGGSMLGGVTRLALGPSHGCAECEGGVFWCWGEGSPGEGDAPGLFATPMNALSW